MKYVHLILLVGIHASHDIDDVLEDSWLSENGEETFIIAKFSEDIACVESLVQVAIILPGEHLNQRVDDLSALLCEDLEHLLLLRRKLWLCRLLVNI